jgi:DNA-binding CsgD family transcriptional regulator
MIISARKAGLLILLLINTCNAANCHIKDVGLPFIKNYSREIYSAGSQNWDIAQDKNGLIYFANNSGILEFDGSTWQLYKVSNESVVRSIAIGNDNRIYAGAFNEIGYLEKTPSGKLKYRSLVDLIPVAYRNFDEIWRIFQTDFGVVFQSFNYVFILKNNNLQVLKPFSNFSFSFYVNGKYYIVDREKGILMYQNGALTALINDPQFSDTEIRFILPEQNSQLIIGTLNKGIFQFDGRTLRPWKTNVNQTLITTQLFSGILIDDDNFAFGTVQDGIFISDKKGNILQHINRATSLQNNTILSVFKDKSENLWLGLDNGISYLEISSPITYFNYCYGIETGYASVVQNNILYLGTNQGLFAKNLDQINNQSVDNRKFKLVSGTEGQVWCLKVIDNEVFCGHNNGVYLIQGFVSQKISNTRGGWSILQLSQQKNKLLCGTYNGLVVLEKTPGSQTNWRFSKKIKGFNESCKTIIEDYDGSIWVSHGYKGIYRLKLTPGLDSVVNIQLFTKDDGLPQKLPYNLNKIDNTLIITTTNGIFIYDAENKKFVKAQKYNSFFQNNHNISQIIPDAQGNQWYFANGEMGVYRYMEDGSYKEINIPFLKFSNNLIPAFEHLYPFDNKNVFIGTQNGFVHYDPSISKDYYAPFSVYIRNIKLLKSDSNFTFQGNKGLSEKDIKKQFSIPHRFNSLSFSFSATCYEDPDKTEFRYRLIGYDDTWSAWEPRNIKEFTNLREGKYTFEVQATNLYKNNSATDSFTFYINPPFYRSKVAYTFYFLLLVSAFIGNIIYFRKRIERTRRKEKLRHEKKMIAREQVYKEESIIAEKAIERLKNEKLTTEIKHKNKELANSTMHLIQKNKFLSMVKNEINTLVESNIDNSQKSGLKRLLRHIDKDISNEKYWKVFDDYFDDVHQDFLTRMKEKHKNLSPKELRLCAYLRMNLSSKEIAVLMNISIRGVEVSRYRLRKKLEIERDINLTEYILNF